MPAAVTSGDVGARLPVDAKYVTFSQPVSGQVPVSVDWITGSITWGTPAPEVPSVLTDIQFGLVCADRGWMTMQEAEDWCGDGSLPQRALDAIALLPTVAQGAARVRFRGARFVERLDPFLPHLQAVPPVISNTALDQAFIDGAEL